MEIKIKAAPEWWGEGSAPNCVVFYDWVVAHVDGDFVVQVDDDQADEVRGRMIEELPVDDSEKAKASSGKTGAEPAPAEGKD